jgi:hypothetical protein
MKEQAGVGCLFIVLKQFLGLVYISMERNDRGQTYSSLE